jgi:hypothetical protein
MEQVVEQQQEVVEVAELSLEELAQVGGGQGAGAGLIIL